MRVAGSCAAPQRDGYSSALGAPTAAGVAMSELRYEIILEPEGHAPFDAQEFKATVTASGLDTARVKVFRMLKRTYGDGTTKGNPMWWRVKGQRGV